MKEEIRKTDKIYSNEFGFKKMTRTEKLDLCLCGWPLLRDGGKGEKGRITA